jgi:transposase
MSLSVATGRVISCRNLNVRGMTARGGARHDRDVNAAANLAAWGEAQLAGKPLTWGAQAGTGKCKTWTLPDRKLSRALR